MAGCLAKLAIPETHGSNLRASFDPPKDSLHPQQRLEKKRGEYQTLLADLALDAISSPAQGCGTWRRHCAGSYLCEYRAVLSSSGQR